MNKSLLNHLITIFKNLLSYVQSNKSKIKQAPFKKYGVHGIL